MNFRLFSFVAEMADEVTRNGGKIHSDTMVLLLEELRGSLPEDFLPDSHDDYLPAYAAIIEVVQKQIQ